MVCVYFHIFAVDYMDAEKVRKYGSGVMAAVSVQLLFAFIGSAMAIHNFACGLTIILITFTSLIYLKGRSHDDLGV